MLIINPGSEMADEKQAVGWSNTHKTAKLNAYNWFYKPMIKEGFTDIEVTDTGEESDGRWKFIFKHKVTGKEIELETHGIDNLDAYKKQFIFAPRVYWNGGSSSTPGLDDFKADGFRPVMTYAPVITAATTGPDTESEAQENASK